MNSILTQIVVAFLTSAFTLCIAALIAFQQFRSERWWERKADAYSAVIDALYSAKNAMLEEGRTVACCLSRGRRPRR